MVPQRRTLPPAVCTSPLADVTSASVSHTPGEKGGKCASDVTLLLVRYPDVVCGSVAQTPSRSARRRVAKRRYARLAREAAAAGRSEAVVSYPGDETAPSAVSTLRVYIFRGVSWNTDVFGKGMFAGGGERELVLGTADQHAG